MIERSLLLSAIAASAILRADAQTIFAEPPPAAATPTALDAYVAADDPAKSWEVVARVDRLTHTELVVRLTSQQWRDETEVSEPVWRHWLTVVVPKGAGAVETALLFITGGSLEDEQPEGADRRSLGAALMTQTVVATLRNVPSQPLVVLGSDEPQRPRYEDDLLAASWNRFLATEDPTWVAQLAMTKAAVAAMDAVQDVVPEVDDDVVVERFTVAGASKRGWTTWLTAAVDDRVAAIAPIVIDLLNVRESMRHHRASYGKWSKALGDYERQGLADRLFAPEGEIIAGLVDPYAYRDRLTMPKCVINAAGDEFFLPDSSRYYFDDLTGEKHLSYTPNSGHSLRGTNALDTLVAFHAAIAHGLPRPTVTWTGGHDAADHTIDCSAKPTEAVLWRAVNPSSRDFRLPIVGEAFEPTPLEPEADGSYRVAIEAPPDGYSATFARFTFDLGAAKPFRVSTPVWVAPDVEPFAEAD